MGDRATTTLPGSLREIAITPGDPRYPSVRSTYIRPGAPALVLQPRVTAEVAAALAHARRLPGPLSIRSGGHGISGRSTNTGGVVIDLSRMDAVEVLDHRSRRVRIGPGATWAEVAEALAPHGWAITSGDYGGVGVGGIATAGGVGWLARQHGLTIDHVVAADVVLADSRVVHTDADHDPDLLWAIRGAGGNVGIVTAVELLADEVGDVGVAQHLFEATDTVGFLTRWGATVTAAPRDLTSFATLHRLGPDRVLARVTTVVASPDPRVLLPRSASIAAAAPVIREDLDVMPYHALVRDPHAPHDATDDPTIHGALVPGLARPLAADIADLLHSGVASLVQLRSVGGAVADVAPDATAYAHRDAAFHVLATGPDGRRLDRRWDAMRHHFRGLYINFETDQRPERLADAFPPATLSRLRAIKSRVDPEGVFTDNFPAATRSPAA